MVEVPKYTLTHKHRQKKKKKQELALGGTSTLPITYSKRSSRSPSPISMHSWGELLTIIVQGEYLWEEPKTDTGCKQVWASITIVR